MPNYITTFNSHGTANAGISFQNYYANLQRQAIWPADNTPKKQSEVSITDEIAEYLATLFGASRRHEFMMPGGIVTADSMANHILYEILAKPPKA